MIAQATRRVERWYGRADVLLRKDRPSDLSAWSYELVDTEMSVAEGFGHGARDSARP